MLAWKNLHPVLLDPSLSWFLVVLVKGQSKGRDQVQCDWDSVRAEFNLAKYHGVESHWAKYHTRKVIEPIVIRLGEGHWVNGQSHRTLPGRNWVKYHTLVSHWVKNHRWKVIEPIEFGEGHWARSRTLGQWSKSIDSSKTQVWKSSSRIS